MKVKGYTYNNSLKFPTMSKWRTQLTHASVLVTLLGLVFVIGGVALWYLELAPNAGSIQNRLYSLVVHVLFGSVILILGLHIQRSELIPEERFAVIVWCYGGFLLMFVLSVWGHLESIVAGELTVAFASDFVVFTSLGGAFGVVSGVNWGRATRNKQLADRNEEQRETLALLTRLLSHDIRNDLSVVSAYAGMLAEHSDEEVNSQADVIQTRIDQTVQLLEDARALVKSIDEDREFSKIDLTNVLTEEVETISTDNPAVTVETDIPSGLRVEADDLIYQLFSNLLQNAVFHNDSDGLVIKVSALDKGEAVQVEIADNGKGISREVRETCFELGEQGPESTGDGIGLYLVSRLAEVYNGSVDLDESPSGGAQFLISIPTPAS